MILAVNGTLMRGLGLNPHLLEAGGIFVSEETTAPVYRLWSIHDDYPGMVRSESGGASIAVELWELPTEGILQLFSGEPEGLCLGKVTLADNRVVPGILAEAWILKDCKEITRFGGWRKYLLSIK
jgi:Allophanate hydrolase C-terminal domain